MPTLGTTELIILLVIVLILFGGSRIGELGGALGRGIREFKTSVRDDEPPVDKDAKDAKPVTTTAAASTPSTRDTAAAGAAPASTGGAAPSTPAAAPGSAAAAGAPPPAGGASTGAATTGMTEVGATPSTATGDAPPRREA